MKNLKKFAVKVEETLGKTFIVEAEDFCEAVDKIEIAYYDRGDIVLDYNDIVNSEVKCSEEFGYEPIKDGIDLSYYEHYKKHCNK